MNDILVAAPPGGGDGGRPPTASRRRISQTPDGPEPEPRTPGLTKLQTRTFLHPHQRRVVHTTVRGGTLPGATQLLGVFGPPGVGKTKTSELVENALAHHFKAALEQDAHVIPVVSVEAPPAINHEFPWREFLKELLLALGEPAVDRLIDVEALSGAAPPRAIRPARLGTSELLRISIKRFRDRGVKVLLVDEAQHMAAAPGLQQLRENLDVLKGFANKTGVRVILFGTYELLDFHRASAQLARRMQEVHFPRYRWSVPAERAAFEQVARAMLETIDRLDEETIAGSIEACYERSLGCVGELRNWLVRAEHEFRSSGRSWSACLVDAATSVGKASFMLAEIEASESEFRKANGTRQSLRLRLGLSSLTSPATPSADSGPSTHEPKTPAVTRRRRPGRRKPTHDPVGHDDVAA
jgi:hypothetical protein